jgi:multidrug resistance efflux pump
LAPAPEPSEPHGRPGLIVPSPSRSRARRGRWIVFALLVAAAGSLAYWRWGPPSQKAKLHVAVVRTARARVSSLDRTLRVAGVTTAERSTFLMVPPMLGSRRRGLAEFQQILQKLTPSGTYVRKGDVVAQFDPLYQTLRLDDYRASADQHAANLRSLGAILDVRRSSYNQTEMRYKGARDKYALEVKKNPVLSANEAERNRLTLSQYEAQYKEIKAEEVDFEVSEKASIRRSELDYQVSQLEFGRAKKNVDQMTVRAPMDGILVVQTIHRGSDHAEIREGDELYPGQTFLQIVDIKSMAVNASVNQVDMEQVRIGQKARIKFDAFPGLELPAHVASVGLMARVTGWRANYVKDIPVRIKLDGMDSRVIPNYSVSADVVLESAGSAVVVPRESIFTDPGGEKSYAFVRSSGGWERRDVELGPTNNVAVAVRAGLNGGEEVALERPAALQAAER